MNHQQVIDWKLQQLQDGLNEPMSAAMQDYINQHPDLTDELQTLEQFWQQPSPLPQPSASMRARFYHALSDLQQQAPPTVTPIESARTKTTTTSFAGYNQKWWLQAAVLAVVFVLGMFTGRSPQQVTTDPALSALQAEVASLSTVMAISMLQHNSASQRLAGVSYTRQANLADPLLLDTIITSLEKEQSTAVKLAIIDALHSKEGFSQIENKLIGLALAEQQPLVQMSLCRLLLERGSPNAKRQLVTQLREQPLDQDVEEFLQLIDAQSRV